MSDPIARAISCLGLVVMIAIAWAASVDRRRIPWRTIASGLALQLALAVLLLKTPIGSLFFDAMNAIVRAMMTYTDAGVQFVFGALAETGFSFVVNVLPIILVMGSAFAVLYHLGVLQRIVNGLGYALSRTMGTSGAESLAAVANIFVGMAESALIVGPYLERMTRSELFTLMTVVGHARGVVAELVETAAHETLGRVDRAFGVGDGLSLGDLTDENLALVVPRHYGRCNPVTLLVDDDLRVLALHHRDDGVGRPEVDADNLCHVFLSPFRLRAAVGVEPT